MFIYMQLEDVCWM